jgi:hypothetical protein
MESVFKEFSFFVENLYDSADDALSVITGTDVLNQRAAFGHRLKQVASVLRKWTGLRLPGVSNDVISVLDQIRTKGATGVAVMTLDNNGSILSIEQAGIQDALNDAYSAGR